MFCDTLKYNVTEIVCYMMSVSANITLNCSLQMALLVRPLCTLQKASFYARLHSSNPLGKRLSPSLPPSAPPQPPPAAVLKGPGPTVRTHLRSLSPTSHLVHHRYISSRSQHVQPLGTTCSAARYKLRADLFAVGGRALA